MLYVVCYDVTYHHFSLPARLVFVGGCTLNGLLDRPRPQAGLSLFPPGTPPTPLLFFFPFSPRDGFIQHATHMPTTLRFSSFFFLPTRSFTF